MHPKKEPGNIIFILGNQNETIVCRFISSDDFEKIQKNEKTLFMLEPDFYYLYTNFNLQKFHKISSIDIQKFYDIYFRNR